jgi:hypothetical protein
VSDHDFEVADSFDTSVVVDDGKQVRKDVVDVDCMSGKDVKPLTFRELWPRGAVEERSLG